jgi:arylsulfatase
MAERWEAWAKEALAKPWPWGAKKIRFSKKKNFTLKQGDHLPQTEAPMVRKRGFTVTATVETKGNDGVIVAQGGTNHGWALHVWKGQLRFVTRHGGRQTSLMVEEPLSKSAVKIFAELNADGSVTLKVDDKVVIEGKTPGSMLDMPLDGLEVGEDRNGAVGEYPANQKFKGIIKRVSLRLHK